MKQSLKLAGLAVLLGSAAGPAVAQEKIKVGIIVTLSGPAAVLGQQSRDGFQLAVKELGGKMAGKDVEVVVVDDELKPDGAVTKAKGLLEREKVDFVVGPIFSNILQAIHRPVTENKTFLISPNAGPSSYAGKECNPFFYVTSYQNDQVHEILGKVAQDRGYKRVYVLVPNYQAGKDSAAGFKLDYKGEIAEESYMPLGTLDFQVELTKISSSKVDALFTFMPGGMGVGLVKQYRQAGLADKIPVLSAFTVDESTLPAQQDAAVGMFGGANWAPNMDNPQNKKFVASYEAAYNSVPGTYAMQGYDTAMLIDSAVKAVKGDLKNKEAVSAALKKAEFTSLRGDFKFNVNGYPIQNFYLTKVAKRADGKFQTEIVEKVFSNYGDRYAKDCTRRQIANEQERHHEDRNRRHYPRQRRHPGDFLEHSWPDLCAEERHRAFLLLACDLPARDVRAAAHPSRPGRVSLHPGGQARLLPRRRRDAGHAGRSGAAADGQAARHLQQVRPHREGAVLGVADAAAVRPVLGHPQHEGADARRRRGAGGRAQHPLPAAASRRISARAFVTARTAAKPQRRRGKARLRSVAAHDGFALGVAQHLFDIGEAVRRQLLDGVDHAFRAAAAVRAHDLRRHRQALLLVGHQRLARMFRCAPVHRRARAHRGSPATRRSSRPDTSDARRRRAA